MLLVLYVQEVVTDDTFAMLQQSSGFSGYGDEELAEGEEISAHGTAVLQLLR